MPPSTGPLAPFLRISSGAMQHPAEAYSPAFLDQQDEAQKVYPKPAAAKKLPTNHTRTTYYPGNIPDQAAKKRTNSLQAASRELMPQPPSIPGACLTCCALLFLIPAVFFFFSLRFVGDFETTCSRPCDSGPFLLLATPLGAEPSLASPRWDDDALSPERLLLTSGVGSSSSAPLTAASGVLTSSHDGMFSVVLDVVSPRTGWERSSVLSVPCLARRCPSLRSRASCSALT